MTENKQLKTAVDKLLKENSYHDQLVPEAAVNITDFIQKINTHYEKKHQEAVTVIRVMRQKQNAFYKGGSTASQLREARAAEAKADQWLALQDKPAEVKQQSIFE